MSKRAFLIPIGQALAIATTISCGAEEIFGSWALGYIEYDGQPMSMYDMYYANGVEYVTARAGTLTVEDDLSAQLYLFAGYSVGEREVYGEGVTASLIGEDLGGSWRFAGDFGLDLDCSIGGSQLFCTGVADGGPVAFDFYR